MVTNVIEHDHCHLMKFSSARPYAYESGHQPTPSYTKSETVDLG